MNESTVGFLFLLALSILTVHIQAKATDDDLRKDDLVASEIAPDESNHSHEAESTYLSPDGDVTDDDDGEDQSRNYKLKKTSKSAFKKMKKRHGENKMRMKDGKPMKEKMKCSMMEKKKAQLDERFHYVWKALMTMGEEIKKLQGTDMDSRFPLDCPPESVNETKCKLDENTQPCSGQGFCSCGVCICNPKHHGMFCECEPCPYNEGVQCGGPERGQCVCGKCACEQQYIGKNCECASTDTATSACKAPDGNGPICSGNGECVCNNCLCQEGFYGSLCQESLHESTECDKVKMCVLCQVFYEEDSGCSHCDLEITMVDKINVDKSQRLCRIKGENKNCFLNFGFSYKYGLESRIEVQVEKLSCQLNFN